jgi:hypothetical protein
VETITIALIDFLRPPMKVDLPDKGGPEKMHKIPWRITDL